MPARWPVRRIEFAVGFDIQISLHVSDREEISDLRADTDDSRPETAQDRTLAKIVGDLLIEIANQANEDLFREKLRRAPVEMEINAVLILSSLVLQIVGEAANSGEFMACGGIEIGVSAAGIDGAVSNPNIGEPV